MTTRDEFEKWFNTKGYSTNIFRATDSYQTERVQAMWCTWQARQQEIDALKAEIERLKSNDHIADISKMVLPAEQYEQQLNMVPADNQDALDAARYRFLKANLVGGFDLPGLYSLDVIDHESWDETIDESMEYTTRSGHETL